MILTSAFYLLLSGKKNGKNGLVQLLHKLIIIDDTTDRTWRKRDVQLTRLQNQQNSIVSYSGLIRSPQPQINEIS